MLFSRVTMWCVTIFLIALTSANCYYSTISRDRMFNIFMKNNASSFIKNKPSENLRRSDENCKDQTPEMSTQLNTGEVLIRRSDRIENEDIAREHAKLVQQINNLVDSYTMRVTSDSKNIIPDESKDESIYLENVFAGTSPKPIVVEYKTTQAPVKVITPVKIIPAIQPIKVVAAAPAPVPYAVPLLLVNPKPIVMKKAIPTKVIPTMRVTKHPYPFVSMNPAASSAVQKSRLPILMLPPQQSWWQRFFAFIPTLFSS